MDQITTPSILIIEDNNTYRKVVVNALRVAGLNVFDAENGQVGLELVKNHNPQLILCDIYMPVMDGMAFLSHIKLDEKNKNIPVIMLTNVQEELENAVKAGAEEAILKSSLSPRQVIEVCQKYLNQSTAAQT